MGMVNNILIIVICFGYATVDSEVITSFRMGTYHLCNNYYTLTFNFVSFDSLLQFQEVTYNNIYINIHDK